MYRLAFALVVLLSCTSPMLAEEPAAPAEQYALLVGCTEYPNNPRIRELWGPSNDIPLFAKVLKDRFRFADDHIAMLVGWPDDEAQRPTAANIAAAFEHLIEKAAPGVQMIIAMNGHGTQLPVIEGASDSAAVEDDGLDEVFLPSDVGPWTDNGLPNAIRDDQIAHWLDQLTAKGASVWIIFDCCHSGTMTRDVNDIERDRGVEAWQLGVPDQVLKAASEKAAARNQGERQRGNGASHAAPLDLSGSKGAQGSLTAFYAAQPYEKAPELPRPLDAARTRDNYYGMFSYVLAEMLQQSEGRLTYRDLARRVVSRYRAERGSRQPTPLFAGELDRTVLSSATTQTTPIYLEQTDNGLQLSAGTLAGLNRGTIVAVHASEAAAKQEEQVLGYLEVSFATPSTTEVRSVEYNSLAAVPLDKLPEASRCSIVSQDLGDLRIKLAITTDNHDLPGYENLAMAVAGLSPQIASLVNPVPQQAEAQWLLRLVSVPQAQSEYGLTLTKPAALLVAGTGRASAPQSEPADRPSAMGQQRPKVFGRYAIEEAKAIASQLGRDLRKIYTWQNVWRVADTMDSESTLAGNDLKLEIVPHRRDPYNSAEGSAEHILHPGDQLELRLSNQGISDRWLTLVYLDANFGVSVWLSTSLKAGQQMRPLRVKIDDSSIGAEGFVVFSVPVSAQKNQPDFDFLHQEPLGVSDRALTELPQPSTPFERLMVSVHSTAPTRQRAAMLAEPTNPSIQSWTWVTEQE